MDAWLEWARGPVFLLALSFMALGLLRHVIVTSFEIVKTMRRAGDKTLPWKGILKATGRWLFPVRKIKQQVVFSLTSIAFHVGVILVPLFLAGHIALWARGLGISWLPSLSNGLADILTIVTIVTAVLLVVQRVSARASRQLSRGQDYIIPIVVAVPFASGFLVMHPALNPFAFEPTLFVHVMSANLVLVLMPLTKLSHAVMLPSVQLISEIGWHWPADSGSRVAAALGKEGEPV